MIYLHTLGDTLIKVGEKSIRPTSPLMFAALLYLGMERGRRVPRAALQEMFFPKMDERSGAHSLRQLLYKLRQLRAPIEVDASSVSITVGSVVDDVTDFGKRAPPRTAAGGVLPDYHPHISEGFSDWVDRVRSALTAALRTQLVAAIDERREVLDWPRVEQLALVLEAIDPFNEVAVLARAEAAALLGSKSRALEILRQYEKDTGRSDLALPSAILRRRIARSVREPVVPCISVPFRGRDKETRELRQCIGQVRRGTSQLFVVGGEPGIGKSRFVDEVARLVALEGFAVFSVRCHPHYEARPFSVFIELVPALRATRGALGISPESLTRLSSLTHPTGEPAAPFAEVGDAPTRLELLVAAVRDLIAAVSSEQPLMLCIDDAHWADSASIRELLQVAHSREPLPVFIACTTRTFDAFVRTADDPRVVTHRLKPLEQRTMRELAQHLLSPTDGQDISQHLDWCVDTAAGNPLFLQMICAHHASAGEERVVPPDMVSAISRRINALPTGALRTLQLVALLGRQATLSNLRALTHLSSLDLVESVHLLEEQGYLQQDGSIVRAHGLLGGCAVQSLLPASKRLLHGLVATTLEARYDDSSDAAILWDCAEHWQLSGETEKAVEFLRKCARHSMAIGRSSDALTLLTSARSLITQDGVLMPVLGEIMLAAQAALRLDVANAASIAFDALQHASGNRCHNDFELASIDACFYVRMDDASAAHRALVCLSDSDSTDEHKVHAARLLLVIAHERCDSALARETYHSIVPLVRPKSSRAANWLTPMMYESVFGSRERAFDLAATAIKEMDRFRTEEKMRLASNTTALLIIIGYFDEAFGISQTFWEKANSIGALTWADKFASLCGASLVNKEDFNGGAVWLQRVTTSAGMQGMSSAVPHANHIEIALWRGDRASAETSYDAINKGASTVRFLGYLRGTEIRIKQLDPEFRCAAEQIDDMLALHAKVGAFGSADSLSVAISEALLREGRPIEALSFLQKYSVSRREGPSFTPGLAQLQQRAAYQASFAALRRSENTRLSEPAAGSGDAGGNRSRHT